jgi:hypothetical protein
VVIVAATSSLPLLALASYLINVSVSKDIRFTLLERQGTIFLSPLERLLDLLPRYQAAARKILAGDGSAKAELREIQQQIDQALATLTANCQGELGRRLKYDTVETDAKRPDPNRLDRLRTDWQKLKQAATTVAAADETAGDFAAALRRMIQEAGNTSNLILDTDLDSFYLVDITLNTLPQTQQRLG